MQIASIVVRNSQEGSELRGEMPATCSSLHCTALCALLVLLCDVLIVSFNAATMRMSEVSIQN